jgi:hypothetical protein
LAVAGFALIFVSENRKIISSPSLEVSEAMPIDEFVAMLKEDETQT